VTVVDERVIVTVGKGEVDHLSIDGGRSTVCGLGPPRSVAIVPVPSRAPDGRATARTTPTCLRCRNID
jgi:hypothetical protein